MISTFHYFASGYKSHARAAQSNIGALRGFITSADTPEAADVVFIHDEPQTYPGYFEKYSWLARKYVIAYSVWEASDLPDAFKAPLAKVQEVWTPSEYCRSVFARYHPRVRLVPHIVERDMRYSKEDISRVMRLIDYDPKRRYALNITKAWDRRKNLQGLLQIFSRTSNDIPDARLVVKIGPCDTLPDICRDQRVLIIQTDLTDSELNALYSLSDIYISAHRSEGWGLCLSDAMAFGHLVVATAYSGPADFLTDKNSIPIGWQEVDILPNEEYRFFSRKMKWAEPDLEGFVKGVVFAYSESRSEFGLAVRKTAKMITDKFSRQRVSALMKSYVHAI